MGHEREAQRRPNLGVVKTENGMGLSKRTGDTVVHIAVRMIVAFWARPTMDRKLRRNSFMISSLRCIFQDADATL